MLDLIAVALLQAVAGDPASVAEQPAQAQQEQAETSQTDQEAEARRRRCNVRQVTGTRLQSTVVCRNRGNGQQSNETRDLMHDVQRPPPLNSN